MFKAEKQMPRYWAKISIVNVCSCEHFIFRHSKVYQYQYGWTCFAISLSIFNVLQRQKVVKSIICSQSDMIFILSLSSDVINFNGRAGKETFAFSKHMKLCVWSTMSYKGLSPLIIHFYWFLKQAYFFSSTDKG